MKEMHPDSEAKPRLIIVEDDLVSSYAMSLMLKDHGFEVVENLMSADNILEDFQKHHPDGVLMDIRLNGKIDGTEAARILRKESDVPIIFISAFNDEETKGNIRTIAHSTLINKPYEISQIVAALKTLIDG